VFNERGLALVEQHAILAAINCILWIHR
jgi:hypothetical protein